MQVNKNNSWCNIQRSYLSLYYIPKIMNFLEQLCKKKKTLKSTKTTVTTPDGHRYIETKDANTNIVIPAKPYGFVIDTNPDNIPAKITENIYLGSQDCCELNILRDFNIRYVLSVGIEAPCTFPDIIYKHVKCLDVPESDIVTILQKDCLPFIKTAVDVRENVLVHCNAGVSRSSSVVLGYLMLVDNLSYNDAFDIVKSKRSCIKPNEGFEKQLRALGVNLSLL